MVNKLFQVIAGERLMVVYFTVFAFWRCPDFPAVLLADNACVGLSRQLCRSFLVLLEIIQIFQKENP